MMLSCFLGNSKHGLYCFCGAYAETWGVCVEQVGVKTPHFTFFGEAVRAANEAVEKEWVEYDIEGTRTAGRGLYLFKDGDFEQALAATQRLSPDRKTPSHFASPTPAPGMSRRTAQYARPGTEIAYHCAASDAQQCHVLYGAT
eukprot:518745-Rhodomonas_salina.11